MKARTHHQPARAGIGRGALLGLCLLLSAFLTPPAALALPDLKVETDHFSARARLPQFALLRGWKDRTSPCPGSAATSCALREVIPEDEEFDHWSTLFAGLLEEGLTISLEQYVGLVYFNHLHWCQPDSFLLEPHSENVQIINPPDLPAEDRLSGARFLIACGALAGTPARGEVTAFSIWKRGQTFVNFYQYWRGPAFDIADRESWPGTPHRYRYFFDATIGTSLGSRPDP